VQRLARASSQGGVLDAAIIPRRCPGLRLALADAQQPLRRRHHCQVRRHGRKIYMSFVTVLRKGAETRVIWRQRLARLPPMLRPPARPPSSTGGDRSPVAAGCPEMGRGGGRACRRPWAAGQPAAPGEPPKRLGPSGPEPWHRHGNERPASRRAHLTPLWPQIQAAAVGARSQGVGSRGGCHVATLTEPQVAAVARLASRCQ
jgi:hypothetical protein